MRSVVASILFSFVVAAAFACTSESGEMLVYRSGDTPTPLWKTVVNATLAPTVNPPPTPDLSTPTPTSTPDLAWTPTPMPTVTPTSTVTSSPSPNHEPLTERETYCRDHALPTATPEPSDSSTPVPTSPPSIPDDEIPVEWIAKMNEIEAWARKFYEIDESVIGEFKRTVIEEQVWREWRADAAKDWAEEEDSNVNLWEQINRTLTLLSPDSKYAEFIGEYTGDRFIGLYSPAKRQIFIRGDIGDFDLGAELTYLHEYSHHLQNEKYDFVSWSRCFRSDGDGSGAIAALIEGDASNTGYEYIENVIGWDRIKDYYDSLENYETATLDEPVMTRYRDEINSFTYGTGSLFLLRISYSLECPTCETNRQRIDEAFERPPYTTEQIYHEAKYSNDEGRDQLSLTDDVLGEEWGLRSGTTIGKSDWIALLATLANKESDEIEPEHPGWRGDYGMLFEDGEGRALYLQVAMWENNRYIESLVDAFDDLPRMSRIEIIPISNEIPFDYYYIWDVDTGNIAMGIELQSTDRIYTMFLAVGPDIESAEKAVFAARNNVTLYGEIMFADLD